jgi:hypothetical protein
MEGLPTAALFLPNCLLTIPGAAIPPFANLHPMTPRSNLVLDCTFGYLSALETPEYGYFGGYLVISPLGRPLEFQCTAPVRPSRAQQILYGPTLGSYLLGEQIGGTLLKKAELTPKIILTDQPAVLFLRSQSSVPFVHLASGPSDASQVEMEASAESIQARNAGELSRQFSLLGCEWELPVGFESDRPAVVELLEQLSKHVDAWEPFGRIHEAIREAQRLGSQGSDAHVQAA